MRRCGVCFKTELRFETLTICKRCKNVINLNFDKNYNLKRIVEVCPKILRKSINEFATVCFQMSHTYTENGLMLLFIYDRVISSWAFQEGCVLNI